MKSQQAILDLVMIGFLACFVFCFGAISGSSMKQMLGSFAACLAISLILGIGKYLLLRFGVWEETNEGANDESEGNQK